MKKEERKDDQRIERLIKVEMFEEMGGGKGAELSKGNARSGG